MAPALKAELTALARERHVDLSTALREGARLYLESLPKPKPGRKAA